MLTVLICHSQNLDSNSVVNFNQPVLRLHKQFVRTQLIQFSIKRFEKTMAQAPANEEKQAEAEFSLISKVKLSDGVEIPRVGLGTYIIQRTSKHFKGETKPGDDAEEDKLIVDAVAHAVKHGYIHIDSAQAYDTERLLMEGIKNGGKERKDIFITSKLISTCRDPDEARKKIEHSVKELGGWIDLFLMHAPITNNDGKDVMETYQVMMDFQKQGKLKSIGVSNFNVSHLKCFAKAGLTTPSVNQIEIHPFLVEKEIVDYCRKNNIFIEAYSPIAQAKKLDNETLVEMGKKYKKTAAHVMLRWGLQQNFIILPKSTTPKRIIANADIFDFKLSGDDMKALDKLAENYFRVSWNVINTVKWDEKHFVKK